VAGSAEHQRIKSRQSKMAPGLIFVAGGEEGTKETGKKIGGGPGRGKPHYREQRDDRLTLAFGEDRARRSK